jgi:hypothetical protein
VTERVHVRKYCGTQLIVQCSAKAAYTGSRNHGHNWASQWLKIATIENGNLVVHDDAVRQFLQTINRVPEIRDDGTRNFDVKLFGQPSFQPMPLAPRDCLNRGALLPHSWRVVQ